MPTYCTYALNIEMVTNVSSFMFSYLIYHTFEQIRCIDTHALAHVKQHPCSIQVLQHMPFSCPPVQNLVHIA